MRRAVSYGGDSDTLGAIVGSIAEAMWECPFDLVKKAVSYLPIDMRRVLRKFYDEMETYPQSDDFLKIL